jgi:methionyl-tRNA synthetase
MAKDILWFHALIWEALLLASDMTLPKTVFAHGFFTIDGQKMSKSLGNVIDPSDLIAEYGVDGARYLLVTSFQFGKDGDISLARFKEKFNSDLANGIGNLTSRIAKLAEKLSANPADVEISRAAASDREQMANFFNINKPDEALRFVWTKIAALDQKMALDKPWEIEDESALGATLKPYIEGLITIGALLQPFMPETSQKILDIFTAKKITKPEPLFLRK